MAAPRAPTRRRRRRAEIEDDREEQAPPRQRGQRNLVEMFAQQRVQNQGEHQYDGPPIPGAERLKKVSRDDFKKDLRSTI